MGFGIRQSFYSPSFVTLDSYSNLHGLQSVQVKNRIGNWEDWGGGGRVDNKEGGEWQKLDDGSSPLPSPPHILCQTEHQ